MPIPVQFQGRLSIPAVAAPMFLVSNPDLVVEACRAGIVGTFPALNNRSSEDYEAWLAEIRERLDRIERDTGRRRAPFGVNLIVHKSNPRAQADLEISIRHKVPLIITSLGAVKELVGAVQGYGGLVFHDVINMRHARKAAEAGVDGLIAVCAGAGGHAGLLSPFALIPEIRAVLPKDDPALRRDVDRPPHRGRAHARRRPRLSRHPLHRDAREHGAGRIQGHDRRDQRGRHRLHGGDQRRARQFPQTLRSTRPARPIDLTASTKQLNLDHEKRAWKNVWSAGQGVGSIDDCPSTAELCARLIAEYRDAMNEAAAEITNHARPKAAMQEQRTRRTHVDRRLGRADGRQGGGRLALGLAGALVGGGAFGARLRRDRDDLVRGTRLRQAGRRGASLRPRQGRKRHGADRDRLLFVLSAVVIWEAVKRLIGARGHAVEATLWAFVVIVVSIVVDFLRARLLYRAAKETASQALEADALHFGSDMWSSIAVLAGLVGVALGYPLGDSAAALVVAVVILIAGWRLGRRTIETLTDTAPEGAAERIADVARRVRGVVAIERRARALRSAPTLFADLVVAVSRTLPLDRVAAIKSAVDARDPRRDARGRSRRRHPSRARSTTRPCSSASW